MVGDAGNPTPNEALAAMLLIHYKSALGSLNLRQGENAIGLEAYRLYVYHRERQRRQQVSENAEYEKFSRIVRESSEDELIAALNSALLLFNLELDL